MFSKVKFRGLHTSARAQRLTSDRRQREGDSGFATRARYQLADVILRRGREQRGPDRQPPRFAVTLKRIDANGVSTIIVETASRFARDLMVQEVGHAMLRSRRGGRSPIVP
jgi:hypothetical protein